MEKKKYDFVDGIGTMLLISGFTTSFSSLMYGLTDPNNDIWFSRIFLSMVCFGFYGIIKRLSK